MTDSDPEPRVDARSLRLLHPAEPEELRAIRRRVDEWGEAAGLSDDMLLDLQLALGEAVANGVEHAYRGGPAGSVAVDLRIGPGPQPAVTVRVIDHGRWRAVPDAPGYRGRGLSMIERLARRVHVLRTPRGTEVCFEIPFSA